MNRFVANFIGVSNPIDGVLVGRYVGDDALAGVGIASLLFWVGASGILGIETGATAAIAWDYGAGRIDRLRASLRAAIGMAFVWGLAGAVLGAQIPDPARLGIDIIFPAAMIGLSVGLLTGRREVVAAIVGAGVGVSVGLVTSPAVGIIVGGLVGPAVGLLVPARLAHETAPLGTPASADRFIMPGAHVQPPPDAASESAPDDEATR